jgi:ATP-dependent exoDNAse (exonuclease V) beta subunit
MAGGDGHGLAATEIGDAVHRLLELVPLDEPRTPGRTELAEAVRAWYPAVSDEELDRIASLVDAYCDSPLARRLASLSGARPERPFSFEHDGVLLHGRFDVLWREGERALVADYKSNVLDGADPTEVVDAEYRLQRLVYALACLRDGADEVEVVYQFLERPDELVSATFAREDVDALEAELSAAIARIREGDFRPTPSEFACSGCPALDLVCAGLRLHGYA